MNLNDFGSHRTGRLVPTSTIDGEDHAFVPDPLPPDWGWPEALWPVLLDAHKALASLDGVGRHLPDPGLLLHPLQQREAQESSRLEGTYTDPQQQMLFQLDPQFPESPSDEVNAYREVFNYKRALQVRYDEAQELPLSLRLVRRLHEVLMEGVRGSDRSPGKFRRVQNQIGIPVRFIPPPPNYLNECLDAFEKYIHAEHTYDPLVEAFLLHYQFEAIHPFRDGNGRVGRLVLAIMIAEWCELSHQWLYMSAYFNRHRNEYIDRLYEVSTSGDWGRWIEFCLRGVATQARDTEQRCDELVAIHREFHEIIHDEIGGSHRLGRIVDDLFVRPVVQIPHLAGQHDVAYNTAKADVERLMDANILEEIADARQRTFVAPRIVAATFGEVPDRQEWASQAGPGD